MPPPELSRRTTLLDGRGDEREIYDPGRHRRRSMRRVDLAGAWVTDRLPLALRSRLTVGAREFGLIAFVAGLALCAVAAIALRSSAAAATPANRSTTLVSAPATAPVSPLVAVQTGASRSGVVVVDVTGAVVHPGVVTLPSGSRVFEALKTV
ncbi:MAG: hypothetical protein ACREJM_15635 [Candidatus Saccharimonadales bacterium]